MERFGEALEAFLRFSLRSLEQNSIMGSFLAAVSQRPFLRDEQIKDFVRQKNTERRDEMFSLRNDARPAVSPRESRAMLTLITEKRQRWPVIDAFMAYIVMDDRQWENPQLQCSAKLEATLPVTVDENHSGDEGQLTFGNMPKKWLYSKRLFLPDTAEAVLTRFLSGDRG